MRVLKTESANSATSAERAQLNPLQTVALLGIVAVTLWITLAIFGGVVA